MSQKKKNKTSEAQKDPFSSLDYLIEINSKGTKKPSQTEI